MEAFKTYLIDVFASYFNLADPVAELLVVLTTIIALIFIGIVVYVIIRNSIHRYFIKRKGDARGKTLANLISSTLKVFIIFIVTLAIIAELGFAITPILAAAGILGLAIGFGSQHLVSDMVAGFFLIVDSAYNLNETIEVDGFKGKVVAMNLRITRVENWMGSVLIINNGSIKKLINWSRNNTTAVVDFGVAYETDLSQISSIMPAFLEKLQTTYEDIVELPNFLGVTDLADSSINLRIVAKTKTGNHFAIERKIRQELVALLNEHNIEIPFPQIVVSKKASSTL